MPNKVCHPERNVSRAKREIHGVGGPLHLVRTSGASGNSSRALPLYRVLKNSTLTLILVGAAVHRCDKGPVFGSALAAGGDCQVPGRNTVEITQLVRRSCVLF